MQETWVPSLVWEDPLEKETASHSSTLTWKIPLTGEPGGLQAMAKSWTWLNRSNPSKSQFWDLSSGPVVNSPSNAGSLSSIPDWGAKTPHASGPKDQTVKQKQYCNKFNKDFKNCPCQKKKNQCWEFNFRADFTCATWEHTQVGLGVVFSVLSLAAIRLRKEKSQHKVIRCPSPPPASFSSLPQSSSSFPLALHKI